MVLGVMCVILGAGIWLLNLYGGGFVWGRDWPFLLLVFGIYQLWSYLRKRSGSGRKKIKKKTDKVLKALENREIDVDEALKELEE